MHDFQGSDLMCKHPIEEDNSIKREFKLNFNKKKENRKRNNTFKFSSFCSIGCEQNSKYETKASLNFPPVLVLKS